MTHSFIHRCSNRCFLELKRPLTIGVTHAKFLVDCRALWFYLHFYDFVFERSTVLLFLALLQHSLFPVSGKGLTYSGILQQELRSLGWECWRHVVPNKKSFSVPVVLEKVKAIPLFNIKMRKGPERPGWGTCGTGLRSLVCTLRFAAAVWPGFWCPES